MSLITKDHLSLTLKAIKKLLEQIENARPTETTPDLTGLATEDFVTQQIANLVNSAPETLNTLDELAAALGDDANFATTVTTELGKKANSSDLGALATKNIITKTDLDSSVQSSLDKADSALQSFTETDPTVPAWAKEANKPTYTASEVGALPADTVIPTVPANISAFTNDAGYLTEHQSLNGLATETYVDDAIANLVNSAPDALNTLDELAAALGDDENFATTVTNQIAGKLDASALPTAINDALAQAKASGEFNGADGKDGTNGADGYSPVCGIDYWTDADKAEIKAYIDDNMPEGTHSGGSSDSIAQVQTDYEQNDTTAVDYIKNRPFYEETKNVFNQSVTTAPNADFMNMNLYPHNQCIIDTTMIDFDNDTFDNIDIIMDVTMNDTNYSCNLKLVEGMYVIGNIYMYLEAIAASVGITVDDLLSVAPEYGILNVDSGEPFLINFELPSSESSGYTAFLTKEAGTHSFVISQNTIRKINSKFIPKVDGLPSVTTADNDKILMVVDGAWTVASIDNGDEVAY